MTLFFDRSTGTVLPKVLSFQSLRFPTPLEWHQRHFRKGEQDDIWLAEVGQKGWAVIGHDYSYHKRPTELSAIKQYGVGCFYLWGANATRWEKLQCFARAYDRIVEKQATTSGPFIYWVNQTGALRLEPLP